MEHYYNHGTNEHNCCREPGSCTCESTPNRPRFLAEWQERWQPEIGSNLQ